MSIVELEHGQQLSPPFKLLTSETVPLTKELVDEMRAMKPSPTERDLSSGHVDFLRGRYNTGLFHPPHWVVAIVNGEKMRANGQHSSEMLSKLNGEFREGMSVHLDTFECDDIESLVWLFRQFDDRRTSRSVKAVAGAYQGVEPALAELQRRIGKLGAEAISWHRGIVQALPVPKGDDRYVVFHEVEFHPFLLWLGSILENRAPELCDAPTAAAMYACYMVDPEAATDFWGEVATGGRESEEDHPTTVLYDWLKRRKAGEFKLSPIKQLYQGCVYAWNAYRDGRETIASGIKFDIRKSLTRVK